MDSEILRRRMKERGQISLDALLAILGLLMLLLLLSHAYDLNMASQNEIKDMYVAKMIATSIANQLNTAYVSLIGIHNANMTTKLVMPGDGILQNVSYSVKIGTDANKQTVKVKIEETDYTYVMKTFLDCDTSKGDSEGNLIFDRLDNTLQIFCESTMSGNPRCGCTKLLPSK